MPDDRSRYGSFDKLAEDAQNQIRDILEDDDCPAVLSRALYRSFLNTDAIERAGIEPIRDALQLIDEAEGKANLYSRLGLHQPHWWPRPVRHGHLRRPGRPGCQYRAYRAGRPRAPRRSVLPRGPTDAPIRGAYVDMVAAQLTNAGYAGDDANAREQAERFLAVETKLAKHHWDNVATRDSVKTYNPMSYSELASTLAHFDLDSWVESWQEAYDASEASADQPLDFHTVLNRVIVHEPSFLTGLDSFWQASDLDNLKLWARVHMIIDSASMLSERFDSTNFDFYGKVLSGQKVQRERWKRAVSLVNGVCGEDVGAEYVRRHFPESSKKRMEQLVTNLIDAYRASITSSDWLGEDTKAKALEKLGKFTAKIGYTNHWRDYSALHLDEDASLSKNMQAANLYETGYQLSKAGKPVDKDEWLMNPQTVNAYYEPSMNVIVFPAAILQPPFFNPQAEDAANYGGIGAVIGHEIGHGFDDQGAQYDGDGKLHDWWTPEDKANFEARTKALDRTVQRVCTHAACREIRRRPGSKAPHVNGALTIGENIGDLGGVNIALKAYAFALDGAAGREKDSTPEGIESTLDGAPTIDGFTGLQRFFLSYASIWRTKNRDELAGQHWNRLATLPCGVPYQRHRTQCGSVRQGIRCARG